MRKLFKKLFPEWSCRMQAHREAIASCKAQVIRTGELKRGLILWICQIVHPTYGVVGQHVQVTAAWRQAEKNLKRAVRHVA